MFFLEQIQDFLALGGRVLNVIFFTMVVLWGLILERLWYFYISFREDHKDFFNKWQNKDPYYSTFTNRIWKAELSEIHLALTKNLSLIKTLVALCPLLGLLGTVTGMIQVFEVMAQIGTGNARLMAGGISQATVPTMAGMVGALSGIYMVRILENKASKEQQKIKIRNF